MKEKEEFRPFIHLIEVPFGKYVYDLNTNSVIKVPNIVFFYLKNPTEEVNVEVSEYLKMLKTQGYLKEKHIKVSEHSVAEYYHSFVNHNLGHLTLQVTQKCNLRCEYCTYSGNYFNRGHADKVMPLETAKKAIDYFISHSRDASNFAISFYGGEPLLEFELIKQCVKYADDRAEGRKMHYNFTTNGTLLTEDKYDFLVKHDFRILVSLDGPQEVHDRHRVFSETTIGSFQQLLKNLNVLKEKYPEYYAQNVSFNTVLDPAYPIKEICDFMKTNELIGNSMVISSLINDVQAKEMPSYSEQFIEEYEYEKFKNFLWKLGRLECDEISPLMMRHFSYIKRVATIFERGEQSELPDKGHRGGPCIPGVRKLFVNVEGKFYPCERVSETSEAACIGHIDRGIDEEKALRLLNIEHLTSQNCRDCWAYALCRACFTQADDEGELSQEKLLMGCPQRRMQVEAEIKDYLVLRELGYRGQLDA